MNQIKYQLRQQFTPTVAPLTAAVSLALSAGSLQAATITVTSLADGSVPGQCTLRDAMISANTDSAAAACSAGSDADTIVFQSGLTGTLTLTGGYLVISSDVTISGPGPDQLTISGNDSSQILIVSSSPNALIDGVRLSGGNTNQFYGGAAVLALSSEVTLSNCEISDNASGPISYGGAITAFQTDLSIEGCAINDNVVVGTGRGSSNAFGGGLLAVSSTIDISDSVFSNNQAGYHGGAIALINSQATITDSSLSANQALFGGALSSGDGSYVLIYDTLASLNEAAAGAGLIVGAGAYVYGSGLDIYANFTDVEGAGVQVGSGSGTLGPLEAPQAWPAPSRGDPPVFALTGPGNLELIDSTISANLSNQDGGGLSAKYASEVLLVDSVVTGNQALPPLPLNERGGGGPDYAGFGGGLLVRDQAYLVGQNLLLADNQAIYGGGGGADTGGALQLYESLIDNNQASVGGGLLSGFFSTPIIYSNAAFAGVRGGGAAYNGVAGAIASTVSNNTADFGAGLASIYGGLTAAKYSTISNNQASVDGGGALAVEAYLVAAGNQISGNNAGQYGGGLQISTGAASAIISGSSITGNQAEVGGGLFTNNGEAILKYSTVADNSATVVGGVAAVGTPTTPVRLVNTTITDNIAAQIGGLYANGVEMNFLTVSHNTSTLTAADGAGDGVKRLRGGPSENPGGAYIVADSVDSTIANSIFADNISPGGFVDLAVVTAAAVVSMDYSLVETAGPGVPGGIGNLLGVDPGLGDLADNGGLTLTRAIGETSPAIDSGNPMTSVEFDQRASPYPRVFNGRADMGAFEFFIDGLFADRFEQP